MKDKEKNLKESRVKRGIFVYRKTRIRVPTDFSSVNKGARKEYIEVVNVIKKEKWPRFLCLVKRKREIKTFSHKDRGFNGSRPPCKECENKFREKEKKVAWKPRST